MSDSLREKVQARRAALQKDTTKAFDVPGYEGILKARYRVLTWKEIGQVGDRIAKNEKDLDKATAELYIAADTLARACEAVYDADLDESRKDDDPLPSGSRWSPTLAHDLGFPEPQSARQAIFAIIARDTQVITHYRTMMDWQDGENQRIDEDLAGEAEPPQPSS